MAAETDIEWTDATWNPITGCTLVSEGCRHCYAARWAATRLQHHPSRQGLARLNAAGEAKFTGEVRFNREWLDQPLRWKKPRMIFVCAHGDLFHESVPDEWIDMVFVVMALCPQHTFQVLTKRPERMRTYLTAAGVVRRIYELACDLALEHGANVILVPPGIDPQLAPPGPRVFLDTWPLPNVWLGTSVEDQATAGVRIPYLMATPAAVRWISAEPLLGPIDLESAWHGETALDAECWGDCAWCEKGFPPLHNCARHRQVDDRTRSGLDWVVVGGESGPHARPMSADWVCSLRDQCKDAGVPFFFKQWGGWIDADQLLAQEGGPGQWTMSGIPWAPPAPLDYSNATHLAELLGKPIVHHSDGTSSIETGKGAAGALLDGVAHKAWPVRA